MKLNIFFLFIFLSISIFAQEHMTIFYFGATSCGPCNRSEVIESIKKIKSEFDSLHQGVKTKYVMVCLDEDISEGIKFIEKYGYWDEISIGSWSKNELVLENLNKSNMPGVPHIFVSRDTYEKANHGVELIKTREFVKEIIGGDKIVEWVKSGFILE